MQTLAANKGNEGSSGLILAHSLNTDTAPTPWNAHTHTRKCQWQIVINEQTAATYHSATDDMDRFWATVSNIH